jgi:hypothetical protein
LEQAGSLLKLKQHSARECVIGLAFRRPTAIFVCCLIGTGGDHVEDR